MGDDKTQAPCFLDMASRKQPPCSGVVASPLHTLPPQPQHLFKFYKVSSSSPAHLKDAASCCSNAP